MKSDRHIGHALAVAATLLLAALSRVAGRVQSWLVLCDFTDEAALKAWEFNAGAPRLVQEPAIPGRKALEIAFDPAGQYQPAYMSWQRVRGDWSGYDALILDVFNPASEPVEGILPRGRPGVGGAGRHVLEPPQRDHDARAGPHALGDLRRRPLSRRGRQPQQRYQAEHRRQQHRPRGLRLRGEGRGRAHRAREPAPGEGQPARRHLGFRVSARPARA